MTRWRWFWFGALSLLLSVQLWSFANNITGGMLSNHVIPLVMHHPLVWLATFVAWLCFIGWLTFHWFVQYRPKDWNAPRQVLTERRNWLNERIKAKQAVGWDVAYDTRERDALTAILEGQDDRTQ